MSLLESIAKAWEWRSLRPKSVVDINVFGNVIVLDESGRYWRICPEGLSCEPIAVDEEGYRRLRADPEFERDWAMGVFLQKVRAELGPVAQGQCYCLKIPAVLGGKYATSNVAVIDLDELMRFAGDVALQIKDLPDGAQIRLKVTDT